MAVKARRPADLRLEPFGALGPQEPTLCPQLGSDRAVNLSFRDLSYSVKSGIRRESRNILHSVSGEFQSGELTAIMGPSGAGKSSLMNILAGYTTRGVTGSVCTNGEVRNHQLFQQQSCYIMQDDQLQPLLTVQEAMTVAANLKLGSHHTQHFKSDRVALILRALGLSESVRTRTGSLSGGQRKRLAIALELVNNPPVMFFDEPTSGLDSSSTKQCLSLLKLLAQEGRTIVCTIHQPSASLFEMFDHLYALSEGSCVYQGSIKGLVPFLGERGLHCPPYHNPADFLLEVLMGEHGDTEGLVTAMENGKCQDWRRRQVDYTPLPFTVSMANGLRTPVSAPRIPRTPSPEHLIKATKATGQYPTTFLTQFAILIQRTFLINLRDRFLMQTRLVMHLVIGLLIGMLYYNIGNDAAYVKDNFGFLYFCIMFIQFTAFSSKILTFPLELPILVREYFNRWYSLKSYYLAATVADAPIQLLCTVGYVLVAYFLTSQPRELHRFSMFLIVCLLVGLVSQSIGMLIGISMGIQNGMVFGPLAIMPFLIFSGFFVTMKDAPSYFEWVFHASYLKYSLEGVMQAMYSYGREKLPCSADYCHYTLPHKFLEELDMNHSAFWIDVIVLVSLDVVLKLLIYLVLLYKLRHSR